MFSIRETKEDDLESLLDLYTQLHDNPFPNINEDIKSLWKDILLDKHHHIIVCCIDKKIVSSCVIIIVPNLTHNQRPYALIENVITDKSYRKKGFATATLDFASEIAKKQNCYKIMLLTGSKEESTLKFYEKAGFNSNDKTAFIRWL